MKHYSFTFIEMSMLSEENNRNDNLLRITKNKSMIKDLENAGFDMKKPIRQVRNDVYGVVRFEQDED
jgi:hypothetical protein